jgi:hypothetical protein
MLLSFAAFDSFPSLAPKPVISLGGVVNTAGLAPVSGPGHALALSGIASIFGQNLGAAAATDGCRREWSCYGGHIHDRVRHLHNRWQRLWSHQRVAG